MAAETCPPHRWRITDAETAGGAVHRHECLACGVVDDRAAQAPAALFDDARAGRSAREADDDAVRAAGQAISGMLRRMREEV